MFAQITTAAAAARGRNGAIQKTKNEALGLFLMGGLDGGVVTHSHAIFQLVVLLH